MKKSKQRTLMKISRTHVLSTVVIYMFVSFMVFVVSLGFIALMPELLVESVMRSEAETVTVSSRLFEDNSPEEASRLLSNTFKDHFITDLNGNILYEHGNNSCDLSKGLISIVNDEDFLNGDYELRRQLIEQDKITIYYYPDTEARTVKINKDGDYEIDIKEIYLILKENSPTGNIFTDSLTDLFQKDFTTTNFPIWVSVPIKEGNERLIVKTNVSIYLSQIRTSILLLTLFLLLLFLIFVVLTINSFSTVISKNRMSKVTFTDLTTKGHNWVWFLLSGNKLLSSRSNASRRFAVINLVIVKYRNYCMCHSIEKGEELLKRVNSTIASNYRYPDIFAHCSNSNYAILVKVNNEADMKERLNSMLSAMEHIIPDHRFSFHVGIDMIDANTDAGGRIVRRKDFDLEKHYNNACTARSTLDNSDDTGIAVFDDELVSEQKWIDTVQERQEQAIANEEFMVYYQPKYDPRSDTLKGAEALIRWQSPEFGLVPPGKMIPIFEKNGFITEIDHYMISHVARDQKKWLDSGFRCVPVSVNVSRAHFSETDLAEQICELVDKEGAPHELIEIELTESAFFDNKKAMINTITKLKKYGFAVSMDDFGSGYSSLNSLKDMPLDVLKLDADFFRGESEFSGNGKDPSRSQKVVIEAIRLAKSLDMRTVAEGVEVRDQVDFLAREGCDMIQGYFYAKPMPRDEFEKKMQSKTVLAKAPE